MVWPRVKEGRGGYHHEDVKHASARKVLGKIRRGGPRKDGWTISGPAWKSIQDDGRHGTTSNCVAREDKGRPIATWRRPLGEKVRSVTYARLRLWACVRAYACGRIIARPTRTPNSHLAHVRTPVVSDCIQSNDNYWHRLAVADLNNWVRWPISHRIPRFTNVNVNEMDVW